MMPAAAADPGKAGRIGPDTASRKAFIRANTEILSPPHVRELRLHLASEAFGLWHRTEEELEQIGLPPPYWAFAWAGGQALARHLLDNPALCRGRTVIDIGTGSGIAAIAAAKSGAGRVVACDIDAFSIVAAQMNAALNGAGIETRFIDPDASPGLLLAECDGATVILLADVFYEQALAGIMRGFALGATRAGHAVLVGDPSRAYLPRDGTLEEVACYEVPVTRALEDAEIRRSRVFRFVGGEDTATGA